VKTSVKVTTAQALAAKAWPFEEARKLLARIEARKKAGKPTDSVLFETGYMTNIGDAQYLFSRSGQKAIAEGVRRAIETHFAKRLAQGR